MTALLGLSRTHPDPVRGRLPLRPAPRRDPPFDDELPDQILRLVGPFDQPLPFEPTPTEATPPPPIDNATLPDPVAWSRRLLVGVIECAAGRRPLAQLAPLVSPAVGRGLATEFERCAHAGQRPWLAEATIRTVHASAPAERIAEVTATVVVAGRVRALALRLESGTDTRWRCSRLQLG